MSLNLFAFGLGIGTQNRKHEWLEVFFPQPLRHPQLSWLSELAAKLSYQGGNESILVTQEQIRSLAGQIPAFTAFRDAKKPVVACFLATDDAPSGVPEAYLKLHLLSHRLAKPREQNLQGIFKILPNVAWTNLGPIDPAELEERRLTCRVQGEVLSVDSVDKFPKMSDYIVPSGVRICDASRVRLGAYLGEGTTVMHEGAFNFNSGCEGPNMIEGRVSSSVWVGAGSDLGGGCSTMGVLSGGNSTPLSIGKNCLLGANAGIGIALGDRCTVESGLYVTAGSKVRIVNKRGTEDKTTRIVKARELSGKDDLLFWRNSQDGALEVVPNRSAIELNLDLHTHNT